MKFLIGFLLLITMSGCADTVSFSLTNSIELVGFWYGLWHGIIAPFACIGSLFFDSISIYAIYNNVGFMLGVGFIGGYSLVLTNSTRDRHFRFIGI